MTAVDGYKLERRVERAGIPRALRRLSLDQLDAPDPIRAEALRAARALVAGDVTGLLLTGPVGIGKSTIAATTAMAYMAERGPARWVRVPELCTRLVGDAAMKAEAMAHLDAPGARVLDDLDKVRPSEFAAEVVFAAVDRAVADELPLIVTSNEDVALLAKHWPKGTYGQAIASSLTGYCARFELTGPDRRTT